MEGAVVVAIEACVAVVEAAEEVMAVVVVVDGTEAEEEEGGEGDEEDRRQVSILRIHSFILRLHRFLTSRTLADGWKTLQIWRHILMFFPSPGDDLTVRYLRVPNCR